MPATLLPVPRARFFSTAGVPLVGGKVFTYAAGTNTPLASYTDYSGTIPNSNPVILDSAGEANIWLENQLYKIVLKDANDVTLWTVDNVGQNSIADLAAGFGIATSIASAATVDLGTIPSHFANITGATTISSFGSTATLDAPLYLIKFTGSLTLTNSANLISPTGANITTATNDRAWVEYLGSGAWRIIDYMKGDGTPLYFRNTDINGFVTVDGYVEVAGTASAPAYVQLAEQTTNGSNYVRVQSPAALTADIVQTLPPTAGNLALRSRYAYLTHELSAGTNGGTATATTWTNRVLNTEVDPDGIVALSSNTFTVTTTGTYNLSAFGVFFADNGRTGVNKLRIRNTTDSVTVLRSLTGGLGMPVGSSANVPVVIPPTVVTLTAGKTYALQYYCGYTGSTADLGSAYSSSSGEAEVYAQVNIEYLY